ncbi:hypothetical protein Hdeb2414_s0002g00069461 [Helianthus debilis subsp. tardiflorus]
MNWMICRVFLKNKARNNAVENVEVVQVRNTGAVFYVPRDFDLNLDVGGSSSTGSNGVIVAYDRNTGVVFYVPRDFDLNLDVGGSSSTGSNGVTVADDRNTGVVFMFQETLI